MTEMRDKDTISKGPKKRDALSLEVRHAILIPAGTILRQEPGKPGIFTCPAANGSFSVNLADAAALPDTYRKVVA
jgi:hypothetical protein